MSQGLKAAPISPYVLQITVEDAIADTTNQGAKCRFAAHNAPQMSVDHSQVFPRCNVEMEPLEVPLESAFVQLMENASGRSGNVLASIQHVIWPVNMASVSEMTAVLSVTAWRAPLALQICVDHSRKLPPGSAEMERLEVSLESALPQLMETATGRSGNAPASIQRAIWPVSSVSVLERTVVPSANAERSPLALKTSSAPPFPVHTTKMLSSPRENAVPSAGQSAAMCSAPRSYALRDSMPSSLLMPAAPSVYLKCPAVT